MTGIDPKPVYEILPDFARELGLDPCRNRQEIMRQLNLLRERWYSDSLIPNLFDNHMFCMEVQCFRLKCLSDCHCEETYYGFNLPEEVDGIVDAWEDKEPLHLRSRFWESRFGRKTRCEHKLALTLMPEMFVTQADLEAPDQLWIKAGPNDGNKEGELLYVDSEGKEQKWRYTTKADGIAKLPEDAYSINKIVLPSGLEDCLELLTAGGKLLGRYSGKDLVPCFRRVKLSGTYCPELVLIQGHHKFRDLRYDYDVVEIGSRLILQHGARFVKYGDEGTDGDENSRGFTEYAQMIKFIEDRWNRMQGGMHEDESPLIRGDRGSWPKIGRVCTTRAQAHRNNRQSRYYY